ncbi:hypothetical protein [Sphingomonas fuzhouensis]|uniref:hypothetical protein n=1 Tax=Sphingomonas fuzhouensis TaxID=3106033 RepID=UPI002AFDD5B0|nr:hypothetical protein [Sphingomonas sp. SGZ-02]
MAMDKEEQALLLLTNRLLMDWISIAVDTGQMSREAVERLIEFSAGQVIQGAPWLEAETQAYAEMTKSRLPGSVSNAGKG